MIDTRTELVNALHEAAEIEHGLLIQYLFGALSMKKLLSEAISPEQQAAARGWEKTLLGVAVDEMGHLGTVCNLIAAIGEPPYLARPNFPKASGYYPFAFELVPFSDEFLYRIQVFELPRGFPPPPPPDSDLGKVKIAGYEAIAPDPLTYKYVGELYEQIADAFLTIPQDDLFLGPARPNTLDDWSIRLGIRRVHDAGSAIAALKGVIEDGEGSEGAREDSHYQRFSRIRTDYFAHGRFSAARKVARNPMTRAHRDADGTANVIQNADTKELAELFNLTYAFMLRCLLHYFYNADRSEEQRNAVKLAAARLMSTAIRPLAELLTEQPFADPTDPLRAGPGFELYDAIAIPQHDGTRWRILIDELDALRASYGRVGGRYPRVDAVAETMGYIRRSLAIAARETVA